MNPRLNSSIFQNIICCFLLLSASRSSVRGTTVYSNDFDSGAASLNGLTVIDESLSGPSFVGVVSGQLRIDPTSIWSTYVVANTASFASPFSNILKNNPGTVSWAFNVSNQDGSLNNSFFFSLGSDAAQPLGYTRSSYLLSGGGFVQNRMEFGTASGNLLIEIPSTDGLGTLPEKGSFRITYEPSTDLWSVYGHVGAGYVDPLSVTELLGSVVDGSFTSIPLPYMAWGGQGTGSDFFDNVSVSVVPEPSLPAIFGLAMLACLARVRRGSRD